MKADGRTQTLNPALALLAQGMVLLLILLLFALTHDSRLAVWPRGWTNDWFILTGALVALATATSASSLAHPEVVFNLGPLARLVPVFGVTMWLVPGAYLVWVYPFSWWIYAVHIVVALMVSAWFFFSKGRAAGPHRALPKI